MTRSYPPKPANWVQCSRPATGCATRIQETSLRSANCLNYKLPPRPPFVCFPEILSARGHFEYRKGKMPVQEIATDRVGPIQFSPEEVLSFPGGLPGFQEHRQFVLAQPAALDPLVYFQSLSYPYPRFPRCARPDHRPRISTGHGNLGQRFAVPGGCNRHPAVPRAPLQPVALLRGLGRPGFASHREYACPPSPFAIPSAVASRPCVLITFTPTSRRSRSALPR